MNGVEIRSVWVKNAHELDNYDTARIKDLLAQTGLKACGISSQFFKFSLSNDSEFDKHLEILDKCIKPAHELDVHMIRGFTFWNEGAFDTNFTKILNRFNTPIKMLQKAGMTMVLESDPSVYAVMPGN